MNASTLNLRPDCVAVFNDLQQNADIYSGTLQNIMDYIIDTADTLKSDDNRHAADALSYVKHLRELSRMFESLQEVE